MNSNKEKYFVIFNYWEYPGGFPTTKTSVLECTDLEDATHELGEHVGDPGFVKDSGKVIVGFELKVREG